MGLPMGNHGIKYLAVASFLVFVWFVWRLGLHEDVQEKIVGHIQTHPPPESTDPISVVPSVTPGKQQQPTNLPGKPSSKPSNGLHADILDEAAAMQYCSNFRLKPFPRDRVKNRKIYDLLLINTELEMLEQRMGQMSSGVDYFVILESDRTFTDRPKPLYVQEGYDQFKAYHPQMIRRTMDLTTGDFKDTWQREGASRNAMYSQVIPFLEGAQAASLDDVLLVSDVDEMFKPETLKLLRNCEVPDRVTAQSKLFYYSYQWRLEDSWMHPQATVYKGPKDTLLPDELRHHGDQHFVVADGGWHCSYCFPTVEEFVQKITSFSHTELDVPEFKDPEKIVYRVRNGHDLFDRGLCTRVEANRDAPEFLLANMDRFAYMLDRDPPNGNFRDYTPPPKPAAV